MQILPFVNDVFILKKVNDLDQKMKLMKGGRCGNFDESKTKIIKE
ncbi:hypothetical protein CHRY9393_01495 [Chryseobacterium fistulae]|uniref:Uncharacterized protein n=1 Tax=Chryseobacterium fistulae TaxID=2675058 RepID=A0A6N4XN16_9FLAO|nr:hypothetical protein CHRY9393_01495 [Chryseobacterium fistulae]